MLWWLLLLLLSINTVLPLTELPCELVSKLLSTSEIDAASEAWRVHETEFDGRRVAVFTTTPVVASGELTMMSANERNLQLMRRRLQLASWRSHLLALAGSKHVVELVGSAMHCGARSGIVVTRPTRPLVAPTTVCDLLSAAKQLSGLVQALHEASFVLCGWRAAQFAFRDDGTLQLVDVSALFPVFADVPLQSAVLCSATNHSHVCNTIDGRACLPFANGNEPDELSCRGALHGGEQGLCSGIDERANIWGLGSLLLTELAQARALDGELGALFSLLRARALMNRISAGALSAEFDSLYRSRKCDSGTATLRKSNATSIGFASRNEALRSKGRELTRTAGAPGSTPHCYLHPQLPSVCAPYFINIGAQKAGTQTFLDYIEKHPQVVMAQAEMHFWDYGGVERSLADYYADLPLVAPGKRRHGAQVVVGEKTPRYAVEAQPMAIHAHFPEMRVVFLVREPAARAYSHFLHLRFRADQAWRERSFPFASFGDAIRHSLFNINALHACGNPLRMAWPDLHECVRGHERPVTYRELMEHPADMLFRGLYALIVARWSRPFFPLGKQLLVVRSEALFEQPHETMALISGFLNLTAIDWRAALPLESERARNRKHDEAARASLSLGAANVSAEMALLRDFYAPYEEELAALLRIQKTPHRSETLS